MTKYYYETSDDCLFLDMVEASKHAKEKTLFNKRYGDGKQVLYRTVWCDENDSTYKFLMNPQIH